MENQLYFYVTFFIGKNIYMTKKFSKTKICQLCNKSNKMTINPRK